jgi:AraC family transcriptional regulator
MSGQQILKVDYHLATASLQVTPRPPLLSSHQTNWQNIGLQYHLQPAIQTPEFQPSQHLLVIHLNAEVGVERYLGGIRQRKNHLPGDVTVIPANCNYQVSTFAESEVLLLTLDPQLVSYLAYESIDPENLEIMPHFGQSDPLIHGIGLALKTELESEATGDYLYIESLTNTLSRHLLRRYSLQQYPIQEYRDGLPRYKLSQVQGYINSHLDREIRVEDLAKLVDMSRYYFARLFKQSMGISPYQYVLVQRVEMAKKLLKQKDLSLSLTDIASACGFAN